MGKLYIVGTPIGNLQDITLRALETLKTVDFIACEDKRVTINLLNHYQINKPLLSYFQHSKISQVDKIIALLKDGKDIALVTDAGTPGISDPGNKLVAEVIDHDLVVLPIPGVSAMTTLLSISGLPTDEFVFFGFLPHKKGRQTKLYRIIDSKQTIVLYESVHRIEKLLRELKEAGIEERAIVLGRELTKQFESIYRGTVDQITTKLNEDKIKGEFVLVIEGSK
ncbi:MAG: 16S rRNA (cytidine(1402)-2'-O)-methyltransferase [Parcubacteria group bacterium CG1_02_37_51]|uniref:Ribosomal RNA small subunit methyltransferase I n=2 Tax=Candidatus Komeiliibacteriota TaxID=1817908 RepID=A0A2M8DQ35_9BACT|nr:MAG: 16S rRNA (cytidine(1402)-2'-O)-methyltransferase [Parcubacteria group bacterium CG1_02_37_51]PIY95169.1 MAG: 16S rRNA (cytidine(1402)-2'-O)-methyltransferase [Candidatus Komeilibacteria bacterium CG_4_10_14_0_8_um_filter_37_78]PJC01021.1 MAG: 16S rRNA (cytidine(1402)-2'-O)-methyltransferase [Candidatus Komeilibacteria bacterium CG_4_9_14_0_8_um_filter_36_9]